MVRVGKPQRHSDAIADSAFRSKYSDDERQLNASKQEVEAVKHKIAQIDALAGRLDALEEEARATQPERLAATMR
jgi:hypothetical protein